MTVFRHWHKEGHTLGITNHVEHEPIVTMQMDSLCDDHTPAARLFTEVPFHNVCVHGKLGSIAGCMPVCTDFQGAHKLPVNLEPTGHLQNFCRLSATH